MDKKRRNTLTPGIDVDALEAALDRFREGLSDEELDDLIAAINGEQIAERISRLGTALGGMMRKNEVDDGE